MQQLHINHLAYCVQPQPEVGWVRLPRVGELLATVLCDKPIYKVSPFGNRYDPFYIYLPRWWRWMPPWRNGRTRWVPYSLYYRLSWIIKTYASIKVYSIKPSRLDVAPFFLLSQVLYRTVT